jgi:ABC-2 type transport system ATP-binding protein
MVRIEALSFCYNPQKPVFEQFSLHLPPGNIYGLLGKNGAGKSTLLRIMSGLLFPTSGKIEVAGFTPKDRFPQFLREIYMITEESHLPSMKVKEFADLYSPFYPRFNEVLFEEYIKEFQLHPDEHLSSMSHGQKKKFLLSFGLATDCKFLIMDEPTNGLDIPSKSQFRKVVARAIHEERTFIISTHQVRDMENLIDPIIILDEGKIIFFHDYEQISRALTISRQSHAPDESVLYSESYLGAYTVVKENTDEEETKMNLEILFNAVTSNQDQITQIFNKKKDERKQLF